MAVIVNHLAMFPNNYWERSFPGIVNALIDLDPGKGTVKIPM